MDLGRIQMKAWLTALVYVCALNCYPTYANTWWTFTFDNDVFVGRDQGYTNGLFLARHEGSANTVYNPSPKPGWLSSGMTWSLPSSAPLFTLNSYTLGQMMVTPQDLSRETPDPNDLPYSGTLLFTNTYFTAQENMADKISVSIGMVGPSCGAEQTQKMMHKMTDSTEPKGWDSQLGDEFVFQVERGRIWRHWRDKQKRRTDLVYSLEGSAGLIKVAVTASAFLRWGTKLETTYITPAMTSTRTSNPVATQGGWFFFAGLKATYLMHSTQIDGNTFRNSISTDLDHCQLGTSAGLTYSWRSISLALALEQLNLCENRYQNDSEYGTFTIGWKQN